MIIGTYSGGSASAYEYSTVDELLTQLPDNTANQIDAINVRNSVYTLWERISDVQTVASQSASASVLYTNTTPTPLTIGGIVAGSTFSSRTMQQMWDQLLYPYIGPASSLSPNVTREFGDSNSITLTYNVTKNSNPLTSVILSGSNGYSFVVPGLPSNTSISGSNGTTATQNVNTTFTVTATDGTSTANSSVTFAWLNAIYWGKTPTFAAPSMTVVGTQPAWADGAGVSSGKQLASSRAKSYNGINGAGQYLVFAWPATFGTPTFTINGLLNTAFTKIGTGIPHTNMFGYTNPSGYDIWISNTAQNSPIGSFVIS
jgi:hypothetical protein